MANVVVEDLRGLDRDVARAARAMERWHAEAASNLDDEPADPFDGIRPTSTKSTWDALASMAPGAHDAPLRDALKRWVSSLLLARLDLPDALTWVREASAPTIVVEADPQRKESWRALWRSLVGARTVDEARRWIEAGAPAATPLADLNRTRAERRLEVTRRLGVEHPWTLRTGVASAVVRTAAHRLLDATEDIARSVRSETPGDFDAASAIHLATAREAGEGWPAHLTSRWVDEAMGSSAAGLTVRLPALPRALGAASFARALRIFGRALRVASSPAALPFALRREPAFVAAHLSGFVFGALAADPEFHGRVLHLGRRVASAQARSLARTALLEARLEAARTLLADDGAFSPADAFDELAVRVFGAPLDGRYRGAWPAPRDDEPASFLGLLGAQGLREMLRDRFDVDWFRNPRAWAHLRASAAGPAFEPVDEATLSGSATRLGDAFERALG